MSMGAGMIGAPAGSLSGLLQQSTTGLVGRTTLLLWEEIQVASIRVMRITDRYPANNYRRGECHDPPTRTDC
jgi:hypothetical protein